MGSTDTEFNTPNERSSNGGLIGGTTNASYRRLIDTLCERSSKRKRNGGTTNAIYKYLSDYTEISGAQRKDKELAPSLQSTNILSGYTK